VWNQLSQLFVDTNDSVDGQSQALQNPMHEQLVLVLELLLQLPEPLKQLIIEVLESTDD